jgi:hypothetical protein
VAALPNGNFLLASATTGRINEFTAAGVAVTGSGSINITLPSDFTDRTKRGLLVDAVYSSAYTTNNRFRSKDASVVFVTSRGQEIVEVDTTGKILASLSLKKFGLKAPQGIAINPTNGNIYVADESEEAGGTNKIYEFTPIRDELFYNSSTSTTILRNTQLPRFGSLVSVLDTKALGFSDPEGLTFSADGKDLYVVFDGDEPLATTTSLPATLVGSNKVVKFSVGPASGVPTLASVDKFGLSTAPITFAVTDFTVQATKDFDPTVPAYKDTNGGSNLASLTVWSLPDHGTLTLNGAAVALHQVISASSLPSLRYTANSGFYGVDTFQVSASDGTNSSAPNHVDLFVSSPTAVALEATSTFSIDLGVAGDDRFNNSADGIVFNPTNGKIYTSSSFRINPTDPNTIGWRLIESNVDGSSPKVILQSEAAALNISGQTPYTPLAGVPVLDLVPNDPTDGIQDLGVVQGTGTSRDGNILLLSTRGALVYEVTPTGQRVNGGINFIAEGVFESGQAFDRSAVGLFHKVENGQEFIYVTDFGERLIRKVPALKSTTASPAILGAGQIVSEVKLQTALPESRLQALLIDPVTGNYFVADDASGNAAIYEITPDGKILGSTDMIALGRTLGTKQGLSGAALEAYAHKFGDIEGLTFDATTRTLYASIDDDGVGTFGLANIGRQVVAISMGPAPALSPKGNAKGVFSGSSLKNFNLLVSANNTINVNLAIFFVDDAQGTIEGLKPGSSGYTKAALKRAVSLLKAFGAEGSLSSLSPGKLKHALNLKNASSLVGIKSTEFFFGFLSISGDSLSSLQGSSADLSKVTLSTEEGASLTEVNGTFTIKLGAFSFEAKATNEPVSAFYSALSISSSGISEVVDTVVGDLSGQEGTFSFSIQAFREASFDNVLGFFVVNKKGDLLSSNGQVVAAFGNNANYKSAIASNLLSGGNIQVTNGSIQSFSFNVNVNDVGKGGFYVLPVLAVQGGFAGNSNIYYPVLATNSDTFDRMAFQGFGADGSGYYGFEDLPGGGDKDFDDFVIKVKVGKA